MHMPVLQVKYNTCTEYRVSVHPENNNLSAIFILLPSSGPLAGKISPRSFSIVWKEGGGRQEGRSTATGVAGERYP